jgi:hypothetical protein
LLVSLTTLRDGCVDDVCILNAPDFPGYLTHATTAAYSRAKNGSAVSLAQSVADGSFTIISPIPQATLLKMIEGGKEVG